MSPAIYISAGIGVFTLLLSLAAIIYRTGATESRLDIRIGALERQVSKFPNIPAEYMQRGECQRRTSDFCRKIESVRVEIAQSRSDLLKAMKEMDDKREKARDMTDNTSLQLSRISAVLEQHLKRHDSQSSN